MGLITVEATWQNSVNSLVFQDSVITTDLKKQISSHFRIGLDDFYLLQNGRLLSATSNVSENCTVYAVPRLHGGKGGFGSMLRAIGAQIEKTTNREACRDLSGRRLRDINEEKRLKTWISQQADRERQEADKKQRKIEKLRAQPKHEFSDKQYEEERAQILDKVHDAVEYGFQSLAQETSSVASSSSGPSTSSTAGPSTSSVKPSKKKPKKKGFMFEDEELSLSESELETDILNLEPRISSEPVLKKRSLDQDSDSSPVKKLKNLEDDKVADSELKKEVVSV